MKIHEMRMGEAVDKVAEAAVELDRLRAAKARAERKVKRLEREIDASSARLHIAKNDFTQLLFAHDEEVKQAARAKEQG